MDAVPPQSPPEDPGLAQAAQCYESNIGPLPRYVGERLTYWLGELGRDLVCEAIHRAAAANARSWNYAEKILQSWRNSGVRTVEAARMEPRPARRAAGGRKETDQEVFLRIAREAKEFDSGGSSAAARHDDHVLAEPDTGH